MVVLIRSGPFFENVGSLLSWAALMGAEPTFDCA
jgi:hypothetical protein